MASTKDMILVVAVAANGVIGREQQLPWKLRTDLQRFKKLTMGNCLLMGRKTYESIGRPLPGRTTIVLTRQVPSSEASNNLQHASSLEQALEKVPNGQIPFVVGGSEIYRMTFPKCSKIWITRVLAEVSGDAFFEFDPSFWKLVHSESVPKGEFDEFESRFEQWEKIE